MAPVQPLMEDTFPDPHIHETPIQKFYRDKTILLTGGTGFLGKLIVEKLLRATDVEHIYLLIRNKKGKEGSIRIEELFDDPVFASLKSKKPKYRHKVSAIGGDVSLPGLGIALEERDLLINTVNIVIHGAATVNFNEKLNKALNINVSGTKEIIALCKEIQDLKVLVHISTAFANCVHQHIEEKFYRPKTTADNMIRMSECLDEKTINQIAPTIIGNYPNTYAYTKVLAEDLIYNLGKEFPAAVFRPGIVITTYEEPVPGWIDNLYGPSGLMVGAYSGVFRVFPANLLTQANIVPADYSVNCLLACAWDAAENKYQQAPVYNYIPDKSNVVTWNEYLTWGFKYGIEAPFSKTLWLPTLAVTSSKTMYYVLTFFYQYLLACLLDLALYIAGKKPRYVEINAKVVKFSSIMRYFTLRNFTFSNDNTRTLWTKLNESDQDLFRFDMKSIHWETLLKRTVYGLRQYIVKEDPSTIPSATKRYKRLKFMHTITLGVIYSIGAYILYLFLSSIFLK